MSKQSRQAKAVAEKYGIDTRLTWDKIKKNFYQYRGIYLMLIPVLAFYIVFNYAPLQGLQIAFRNYRPGRGIWGSAWVGLANFKQFFTGPYFWRVLRNTLYISFYTIVICFPAPILFALMLNELRLKKLKKCDSDCELFAALHFPGCGLRYHQGICLLYRTDQQSARSRGHGLQSANGSLQVPCNLCGQ